MRSWARVRPQLVDEWEGGFGWSADDFLRRTSHALVVGGRAWLIDPVDAPELEGRVRALGPPGGVLQLLDRHERGCAVWAERLDVVHLRAWESLADAPFEALPGEIVAGGTRLRSGSRQRARSSVPTRSGRPRTSARPASASACTR
jgi:hypothetical protein